MECLLDESAVEGAAEVDATAASQSDRVAVILQRMVAVAVPMPKLGALRMSDAQRLIPELYEHIPVHLRGYVAHEVRLDDEVAADTERLAAFGGCAVRGMPLSLFPKFYLRFAGRIALYHYCKQKCPEEADEILKRCCFTTSTAASARSKYASMLRYYGGSAGVDAIFCHAAAEQGKRPPAEHPNASKRRRMLYRSLLDFASRRAERSNFGTPIAPHEDLQERCPPPGSFIVMHPCGLQAADMARRGSSLAAGHTTNARTCRAMAAGRRRPSSSYLSCACGTVARKHPIRLCAAQMSPSGFDATFSNATKRRQLTNICGGIAARAGSNWRSNTWTKK